MAAASSSASVLFGLPPDAPVEDIEYVLGEVTETLSRIDSKRGVLQDQIAAASSSRGKRRRASPPLLLHLPPETEDDDGDRSAVYTRKGAGAVRRRLRDAAGDAKKERKRLEAVCGDLEQALVDAKEFMALQRGGTA